MKGWEQWREGTGVAKALRAWDVLAVANGGTYGHIVFAINKGCLLAVLIHFAVQIQETPLGRVDIRILIATEDWDRDYFFIYSITN